MEATSNKPLAHLDQRSMSSIVIYLCLLSKLFASMIYSQPTKQNGTNFGGRVALGFGGPQHFV